MRFDFPRKYYEGNEMQNFEHLGQGRNYYHLGTTVSMVELNFQQTPL